jgi:hypothetical protein
MPDVPPDPTPLEELLVQAHEWMGDERSPWKVLYELSKVGTGGAPPRVTPPTWFARSVADVVAHLSQHWAQGESFVGVRALEAFGLVSLPHDDRYILAMVSALGDRWHPDVRADAIRTDRELREDLVWRVFEVEGGGEVSLANVDKFSRPEASWAQTFRELVADGTLPRDRVLDSCLRALGRDFSAYRAGWFAALHRSLDPTVDELAVAQGSLRRLLRSTVNATVAFAVRALAVVDKAGRLDDEALLGSCGAALAVPHKSTAIGVLEIVDRIARRGPDLARLAGEAVAGGLEHPHRDVQARAFAILRSLDAGDLVVGRLSLLEPSVAREAAQWLGTPTPAAAATGSEPLSVPVAHADRGTDVSLAERGAALLAGDTDAYSIELFLAGAVEMPAVSTELAPLRKQARAVLANPNSSDLRKYLAEVVLSAIGEPGKARVHPHGASGMAGDLLTARLAEIVEMLAGHRPRQVLLATPTDLAGWLDPDVFVSRLTTVDDVPARYDLIGALLRLAPTGRESALASAADVPGEIGTAVRYALGGPSGTIGDASLWLAAARGRAPFDDHPDLIRVGLTGGGAGSAATYSLVVEPTTSRYVENGRTRTLTWWWATLTVDPAGGTEHAERPTVVAARGPHKSPSAGPDWVAWGATIWPHDAESFLAREFDDLWYAAGTYPQVTYATAAVLTALRDHPGRLGPMAAATLALGLAAREVRYRALAVDAFLALIPTGRLPPSCLAEMMAVVANHCPAKRWAAALRDAGLDAGPAVVAVLIDLLPRLSASHGGLNALLETLYEESLRSGSPLSDPALKTWLTMVGAGAKGSKSAQAARALLAEHVVVA